MDVLKSKIKNTQLFADHEKIDILAAVDSYSEVDKVELESIIDEYDAEHERILKTFEKNMEDELDSIVSKTDVTKKGKVSKAADQIKQGLKAITIERLAPNP